MDILFAQAKPCPPSGHVRQHTNPERSEATQDLAVATPVGLVPRPREGSAPLCEKS